MKGRNTTKINKKLILPLVWLIFVVLVNALVITTYAIWAENQNASKFIAIPITDENPSLKYQLFVPLDSSGNKLPGSLNVENKSYSLAEGGIGTVASFGLVGWTGNIAVTDLEIPASATVTVNGSRLTMLVTRIMADEDYRNYRLDGNSVIERITIPESVRTIDAGVFFQMDNLKSLTILGVYADGDGTVSVGDYAFAYCYKLDSVSYDRPRIVGNVDKIFIR